MKLSRISKIEEYLIKNQFASIPELCSKFEVSQNTIRRDIDELKERGVVSKVYGGIMFNRENDVIPYQMRSVSLLDEKLIVAGLARQFIESGETIYIDSGTTTVNLLRNIPEDFQLTIISNSLNVYNEAIRLPHLNVISTGGLLYPKTNSFVGSSAISTIKNYHINRAFMAATGVNLEAGATNNSFHENEIKKAVVQHCHNIILMVDHTKIDRSASITFCPLESVSVFVSDIKPPQPYIDFFAERNIQCLYL
jgi:DeoR family transcriptional regulator, myo-inositol catabolism operon repressor